MPTLQPTFITSNQWLVTKDPEGRDLVFFAGIAGVQFAGDSIGWRRAQLEIPLPGSWSGVAGGVATASLAAVDNPGVGSTNFGYAVDDASLVPFPLPPRISCTIAVQDQGAQILRLSYTAVVHGLGYEPIVLA